MFASEAKLRWWAGRGSGGEVRSRWHHPALLSLGMEFPATAVQEALLGKQTISRVPSFCQFTTFNLPVPSLSAHPEPQICILSLASGWDSKLQVL